MKLKYLGTAAAEGIPAIFCECENCKNSRAAGGKNIRTRSQAIIDDTHLIDFPADTYMHYLMHNFPLYNIKSCIITHSHADHLYPDDMIMRKAMFSHLSDTKTPLTFYSWQSGYDMIQNVIEKNGLSESEVKAELIVPRESFCADGYKITPLRASHAPHTSPVVFLIEKDGKSIFYSNDTSEYCEESMEYLKTLEKPLDLISLDCTEACNRADYMGHLSLERAISLRELLIKENIADNNTVFVLNHFSHNGKNVMYDEFVPIAKEHGFAVSFDGMEIEI